MNPSKPDLLVLPFQASLAETSDFLFFDEVMSLLNKGYRETIQIERSTPGALHAIGWTIFRRTRTKYLYENEPLFRFERGARKYIRKAYAIHYSQLTSEDGMTYSHINL